MKCSKCGVENAENIKFCTSCGNELLAASEVAEEASNIPKAVSVTEAKEEVKADVETKDEEVVKTAPKPVKTVPTAVPPAPPISPQATQPKVAPVQAAPQPVPVAHPVQPQATQVRPQAAQVQPAPQPVSQAQQAAPTQPQYAPQAQQVSAAGVPMVEDKTVKPMTFGGWLWSLIVLIIPLVNFIFILVWSFSSGTNKSKKSFAQVLLLFTIINIIIAIVIGILIAVGGSILDGLLDTAIDAFI